VGILEFFGLDKAAEVVTGIFETIKNIILAPVDFLIGFINDWIIPVINLLIDAIEGITFGFADLEYVQPIGGTPEMAEGAALVQGTSYIAGEAGPEMIVPLEEDAIKKVLTPILPELGLPGLDVTNEILASIERAVRGTLKVKVENPEDIGAHGREAAVEVDDLAAAVGVGGL